MLNKYIRHSNRKIIKSLGIEMPDLTTIDKIDKFKNQLNKDIFM